MISEEHRCTIFWIFYENLKTVPLSNSFADHRYALPAPMQAVAKPYSNTFSQ